MNSDERVKAHFYPEVNAGGFTSQDGTIEFYTRVNALIDKSMVVLDFGAGRASWYEDETCDYRKQLRLLMGKVSKVIACDVSEDVLENRAANETVQIKIGEPLPFADNTFDMIVSDYTFEHIADANAVAQELTRILKPGGWICARTPSKFGYISVLTTFIKNKHHSTILNYAQPNRKEIDVFPTCFQLNSMSAIKTVFPETKFENCTYRYESEPGYFFGKKSIFLLLKVINSLLPHVLRSSLFIFLKKKT